MQRERPWIRTWPWLLGCQGINLRVRFLGCWASSPLTCRGRAMVCGGSPGPQDKAFSLYLVHVVPREASPRTGTGQRAGSWTELRAGEGGGDCLCHQFLHQMSDREPGSHRHTPFQLVLPAPGGSPAPLSLLV